MGKIFQRWENNSKIYWEKNKMMAIVTGKQTAESWYWADKVTGVACDEVGDTN